MSYFFWGTLILLIATAIFYFVFLGLVYYWHEKKTTYVIVPMLYTFEFFITGFFIVAMVSIILHYLPQFIQLVGS